MLLKGSDIIIECLKEQRVDTIFGYPGGTALSVYDALFRNGEGIRHVLTSHEQGAAHAADGYARATGKTGVCMVTSGPGATNLVTGIATAYMDSVPMVAITVNVPRSFLGKDSFQEVDIAGITMPVTKHNFIIKDGNLLAKTLHRAFKIAASGRPGPVLVDITRDVTEDYFEYTAKEYEDRQDEIEKEFDGFDEYGKLDEAAKLLAAAEAPLLLIGGGAMNSHAGGAIMRLLKTYPMPVADTLMGKGVVDGSLDENLGMVGLYGTATANEALSKADIILALGCRFSERVVEMEAFPTSPQIIHIDVDRAELNKNLKDRVAVCSDAKAAITVITNIIEKKLGGRINTKLRHAMDLRSRWLGYLCDKAKTEKAADCLWSRDAKSVKLSGPVAVGLLNRMLPPEGIVVTEVGLNQMWASRYISYSGKRRLLTSGGLGTMGYGLPAAIGAKIGCPAAEVVLVAGDGCFRMNMHELLTARANRLHITELVLDNRMLGMVHEMQRTRYEGRYSQTEYSDNADYAAIARACGANVFTVSDTTGLEAALKASLENQDLNVIVCSIAEG